MDAATFLKTMDLEAWKMKFQPTTENNVKIPLRRGCPSRMLWKPQPACVNCSTYCVVEDAKMGSVVCTACGMIQSSCVLLADPVFTNINGRAIYQGLVVHRYSRSAYFRHTMNTMQGRTKLSISEDHLLQIQQDCAYVGNANSSTVRKFIIKRNYPKRYLRHIEKITQDVSDYSEKSLVIGEQLQWQILKIFKQIEYYWDMGFCKRIRKGRKSFFSYPYLFYQICYSLGATHLLSHKFLLKSKHLLKKQHLMLSYINKECKLVFDFDINRRKRKSDDFL